MVQRLRRRRRWDGWGLAAVAIATLGLALQFQRTDPGLLFPAAYFTYNSAFLAAVGYLVSRWSSAGTWLYRVGTAGALQSVVSWWPVRLSGEGPPLDALGWTVGILLHGVLQGFLVVQYLRADPGDAGSWVRVVSTIVFPIGYISAVLGLQAWAGMRAPYASLELARLGLEGILPHMAIVGVLYLGWAVAIELVARRRAPS